MDETKAVAGTHLTSAAAFVEGGIQEPCDDACSICLDEFCDNDPSTVTNCKHEFHLQCVLEWCQRSSKCPMCWQSISLKDPTSQELLESVERERVLRSMPARNATIIHHPGLGDLGLQHIPEEVDQAAFENRIIEHLAAAMGRTHRATRHCPTSHPNGTEPTAATGNAPSAPVASMNSQRMRRFSSSVQNNHVSGSSSGSLVTGQGTSNGTSSVSSLNQDRAGPSEHHSPSDTWRSRLSSMSTKYKESISRNTKEWKEKLFSRNSSMVEIGSEVRREVNTGLATVSRMMERLETGNGNRADHTSMANNAVNEQSNNNRENSASFAARST